MSLFKLPASGADDWQSEQDFDLRPPLQLTCVCAHCRRSDTFWKLRESQKTWHKLDCLVKKGNTLGNQMSGDSDWPAFLPASFSREHLGVMRTDWLDESQWPHWQVVSHWWGGAWIKLPWPERAAAVIIFQPSFCTNVDHFKIKTWVNILWSLKIYAFKLFMYQNYVIVNHRSRTKAVGSRDVRNHTCFMFSFVYHIWRQAYKKWAPALRTGMNFKSTGVKVFF